jgi:hypothetical protein
MRQPELSAADEAGVFDFRHAHGFTTHYIETFYADLPPTDDERVVIGFLNRHMHRLSGRPRLLEVGCGPTVHHVFPFLDAVSAVDMADYLSENLEEVRRWCARRPDAYGWRQYAALQASLRGDGSDASIEAIEAGARACIDRLLHCDLRRRPILDDGARYDVVSAFYCTEEVGITIERWEEVMANLADSVAPGGLLFLACLRETDFYLVGDARYPCANVTEHDVLRVLPALGFDLARSTVESVAIESQRETGVTGVVVAAACKRR